MFCGPFISCMPSAPVLPPSNHLPTTAFLRWKQHGSTVDKWQMVTVWKQDLPADKHKLSTLMNCSAIWLENVIFFPLDFMGVSCTLAHHKHRDTSYLQVCFFYCEGNRGICNWSVCTHSLALLSFSSICPLSDTRTDQEEEEKEEEKEEKERGGGGGGGPSLETKQGGFPHVIAIRYMLLLRVSGH